MGRSIAWMAVCAALVAAAPASARERTYKFRSPLLDAAGYQVLFGRTTLRPPPVTGYITSMRTLIVDEHGAYVPPWRVMLHHVVYSNSAHRDPVCPRLHGERFFGTGEEDRPLQLPHGYGYPIRRKDASAARLAAQLQRKGFGPDALEPAFEGVFADGDAEA